MKILSLLRRIKALAHAKLLGIRIAELQHYLWECEEDGLTDSLCLREFRLQLKAVCDRQAALLEVAGRVSPQQVEAGHAA